MYPWMLIYYYYGNNWQRSYIFCTIWAFIDWAIYMLQLILFAWASIERHILIFHDKWVSTERKRFFFHYLPLIIIILYWFIFYSFIYFYPSCKNIYNSSSMICITVCLYNSFIFHAIETLFNNIIPNLIIIIFSITLVLRVLWQKHSRHQPIQWRKHRKMTIQLLSISTLYLLITCPWAISLFLYICGLTTDVEVRLESYALYISYYIVIFFPFVAVLSLPELRIKMKKLLQLRRLRRSVGPEQLIRNNQVIAQ